MLLILDFLFSRWVPVPMGGSGTGLVLPLCGRLIKFIHLASCFSFCLKKRCKQGNVLFCFLYSVLVFLFCNNQLNEAVQRPKR